MKETNQAVELFDLNLETGLGPIQGRVAVKTAGTRLAEMAPMAFGITDILVDRALQREREAGREISCAVGCGSCCRQMVQISPCEVFYLTAIMDGFEEKRRAEYLSRFRRIEQEIAERGITGAVLEPREADGDAYSVAREYFSMEMPCPFLENESCSIYPNRPVACREYNVTSPATFCAAPYTNAIETVPMPIPLSVPLTQLAAKLTGLKSALIPLALAPQWTARNREFGKMKWPGVELFQQFIGVMETHLKP